MSLRDEGDSTRFVFRAPEALARYIAPKGSIALNGTSLTVNEVEGATFGVNIIPHTLAHTTWGGVRPGDLVNLEIDTLARYVARLTEYARHDATPPVARPSCQRRSTSAARPRLPASSRIGSPCGVARAARCQAAATPGACPRARSPAGQHAPERGEPGGEIFVLRVGARAAASAGAEFRAGEGAAFAREPTPSAKARAGQGSGKTGAPAASRGGPGRLGGLEVALPGVDRQPLVGSASRPQSSAARRPRSQPLRRLAACRGRWCWVGGEAPFTASTLPLFPRA